jgi:hypothetical protein
MKGIKKAEFLNRCSQSHKYTSTGRRPCNESSLPLTCPERAAAVDNSRLRPFRASRLRVSFFAGRCPALLMIGLPALSDIHTQYNPLYLVYFASLN